NMRELVDDRARWLWCVLTGDQTRWHVDAPVVANRRRELRDDLELGANLTDGVHDASTRRRGHRPPSEPSDPVPHVQTCGAPIASKTERGDHSSTDIRELL